MSERREACLARIRAERERKADMPGSEWDLRHSCNDWMAIAGRYLFEESARCANRPQRAEFEDSLIKAAAVILAALEHSDAMAERGQFSP